MKKKELVVLMFSLCIWLTFSSIVLVGVCPEANAKSKPIVLKAISAFPIQAPTHLKLRELVKIVNERAKGELTIKYIGGPEVIPTFEQPEALKNGVVDILSTPYGFMQAVVPEGVILMVSPHTWAQERKIGLNDFFDQLYRKKMNATYLGGSNKGLKFALIMKVGVKRLQELKGLKSRSSGPMEYFIRDLGMIPVTMPLSEVYGALQRGVVDGMITTIDYTADVLHLYEVCDYFIDHLFWGGNGVGTFINFDKWNTIPKHLQDLLTQVQIELEPKIYAQHLASSQKSRQKYLDHGTQPIRFSEPEAKKYFAIADQSQWNLVKTKVSPENYEKLRQFLMQ
jgi:TRAP-type C4-dicarboxylate transport system substrate-binding protein